MEELLIEQENKMNFLRKERLSDFECWAIMRFAMYFEYVKDNSWWWCDNCLCWEEEGVNCRLWLSKNGNIMLERYGGKLDRVDELFLLRF